MERRDRFSDWSFPVVLVLEVDCSELTTDEMLALASEISDTFEGRAIALAKGDKIVLDNLSEPAVPLETLKPVVAEFVSRRKDGAHYFLEVHDQRILIRSADPLPALRRHQESTLPPNLKQCPMCSFITQYEEEYIVHVRSHYFGV